MTRLFTFALLFAITACSSLQDAVQNSKKIESDYARAKDVPYKGASEAGVVNGHELKPTDPDAKLAVLLLITRGSNLSACTGVLIQKRILATAAHCVYKAEPKDVRIAFQARGNPQSEDMKASKIVVHEKFDGRPEGFSDLALVKLPADPPKGYNPIALATAKEKIAGDEVLLLGYGITGETKKDSMTLRETKKSFKDDIHPKEGYFGIDQKSASGGFCRGDSGAPVLVKIGDKRKLYGINSFTVGIEENTECHTASVAMPAATFSGWIESHAAKL